MMDRRLIIKLRKSLLFRYRFTVYISVFVSFVVISSYYFIYNIPSDPKTNDISHIFNTWKIIKTYKNGKLMLDNKFENSRLVLYSNGTYKWVNVIKGTESSEMPFVISEDFSQISFEGSADNRHQIYELSPTRFRYGQRNILSHYEHVMVPYDYKE